VLGRARLPQAGIVFKDLMPLFADGAVFRQVIDAIRAEHGCGFVRRGGRASSAAAS
jgi:adenine phosphoribosyltransferase